MSGLRTYGLYQVKKYSKRRQKLSRDHTKMSQKQDTNVYLFFCIRWFFRE